jgi:GH35 family endo-1,4-beta-xylanase
MTRVIRTGLTVASAVVAAAPMTARQDARLHPLPWDRQRQPKPAFHAVMDVLKRAR